MNIIFLGCTAFSEKIFQSLIELENIAVKAIFSIPESFKISYSTSKVKNINHVSLKPYADKLGVPFIEVESGIGNQLSDHSDTIKKMSPDVILVMGWYYMIPKAVRDLAKFGAWGIHASLLPAYAGGAPLVWAIINGEKKTGVTLFRLDSGVDDGDIIDQKEITIEQHESIKEVYDKATAASIEILKEQLTHPEKITFIPQDKKKIKVYPQRKPEDGKIDLNMTAEEMYNFIRAQSPPYSGAYIETKDEKKTLYRESEIHN